MKCRKIKRTCLEKINDKIVNIYYPYHITNYK